MLLYGFIVIATLVAIGTTLLLAARNRDLEAAIRTDPLTGISNRHAFEQTLERIDENAPLALVMIDFDNFKTINDDYGHAAGDEALKRVAGAMQNIIDETYRNRGHIYRLGGDEFVLIVEWADSVHAQALIEHLRVEVAAVLESHERLLTISCGIACSPEHASAGHELVSYADRALYQAKRSGRDRVVIYSHNMFDEDAAFESRNVLRTIADAMAAAVDAKDAYTHAHSRNVADLSLYLARTMGMTQDEVSDIALGGLLHDIGKIGVSDQVLKKPGKLTKEEWEEIKTHCEIGYSILSSINGAEHIREMVLYHHERPDGTGYPHGLKGDDIPVPARIIAVADAFDSMTAERVYSTPKTPDEAIEEIVKLRGKQFDESVVDALCELMVYEAASAPAAIEDDSAGRNYGSRAA